MDTRALLARSELFSSFSEEALTRVADQATTARLERNEILFEEGDPAAAMFVVRSGRVGIGRRSPDGRESLVALMEVGDLFGEMPLFDDQSRSASARALERSEVLQVSFDVVRSELEARPELLWDVVELLAGRLRAADDALADAMLLDVTGRTAKRLLELAGTSDEFALPITQEELAGLVGASRERVNKALAAFARLGWVDQVDRRYRILNRERLTQRSR
jgi:CRP/FNR family cyclic AMP-dependent transcriptional regulator